MTNSGKSEQNELCACPAAHTPFFVRFDTKKKQKRETVKYHCTVIISHAKAIQYGT